MPSRDLHIGIDGDARGFDAACADAEAKARGLDRELAKLERQQAAQEKVTARTTAAVREYGNESGRAGLQARKMGFEVEQAAQKAEKAQIRADAAAKAYERGLITEAQAARAAANAETALERASIKAAEAQLAASASAEKRAAADAKAAEQAGKADKANTQMQGGLVSLIAAAAGLAAPVLLAGGAFVAFAGVAAPSVMKVLKAQTDLAGSWSTLSRNQRIAAVQVSALTSEYKALAKSYEPDALKVFNGFVSTGRQLLPELGKTVDATKAGVLDFSTQVQNSLGRELPRLFGLVQSQGTPALHELGNTFSQTTGLAVNLVQGLTPLGMTLLHSTNGVLTLLNGLTALDPRLTELAGTAIALRAPVTGLTGLFTNLQGKFGGTAKTAEQAAGKLGAVTKESKLAAGAAKALGAVSSLGPGLYIAAGAALVYLAARTLGQTTATQSLIASLRVENNAFGNNIPGYRSWATAIGGLSVGYASFNKVMAMSTAERKRNAEGLDLQKLSAVQKAYDAATLAAKRGTEGEAYLAKAYGLTSTQADALATAAGVDLTKGITGSSQSAIAAQAKIDQYRAAVQAANDPTMAISKSLDTAANSSLLLKDRVAALDTAFAALAGPELAAYDATTKTATAFEAMSQAMKKSHGSMDLTTQAGRAARTAFGALLGAVEANSKAQYEYESATMSADKAKANMADRAKQSLPLLLAEARGNKIAANAALDWANSQGLGKTRGEALAAVVGQGRDAFLANAKAAGNSRKEALGLWAAFQKLADVKVKLNLDDREFFDKLHTAQGLKIDPKTGYLRGNGSDYLNKWLTAKGLRLDPKTGLFKGNNANYYNAWMKANGLHIDTKTGQIRGNSAPFWAAVHSIPSVVGTRTIDIHYNVSTRDKVHADGGIDRYEDGGMRRDLPPHIQTAPTVLYGETETGGEAYIPLGAQKRSRSVMLLQQVAQAFGMAVSGPGVGSLGGSGVGQWTGGTVPARPSPPPSSAAPMTASANPLDLGQVMQYWTGAAQPATKAQVDAALKSQRSAVNSLKSAEDALHNARRARHPNQRTIAAAERRIATDRQNLAAATAKLTDVENRYRFSKLSPVAQLDVALGLGIKDNAAFIHNLQTLADRGFGTLANRLLAMGGTEAEKIAASAVKLNTSKLGSLQGKINTEQGQQDYLANLPNILTIRSALKNTKGGISSWVALLNATGLDPGSLSTAVKLMTSDLSKTTSGKALLADMHAHGYARGGPIVGPSGVDQVPMWGTAGEYVVNRQASAANRPLLDALNYSTARVPVSSMPVRGGDGASAGPAIQQTFQTQDMDVHQLARESAREIAWQLR